MEKKSSKINFNLLKYIILCVKAWPIFLACIVVCAGLAGFYSLIFPQKSQVVSQLILKDDVAGGSSMMLAGQIARSFSLGDMFGGSSSTDNETLVLGSHAVMIGAVKDLGLNTSYFSRKYGLTWEYMPLKSPFRLIAPEEMSDTIRVALVFKVKRLDDGKIDVKVKWKRNTLADVKNVALPATVNTSYGNFVIDKTPFYDTDEHSNFKIVFCSYSAAAQSLMEDVKIYVPDRKTDFIDMSYNTSEPKFGIDLLNSIINNYFDVSNIYKFGRTTQTLKLVDDRLESLSKDMLASEESLEKFKIANKLTDVEVDAQYLMTKTGALEASLLEAQTNYELLKLTKDFISNPENQYSLIPEIISGTEGGSEQGLISSYNRMILERMQLMSSAKANNSSVKLLDEQIDAMRANIVSSVDRMFVNASVALKDIKNEDGRTKSRINELPVIERQYITLKRDNLIMEQMYLFLLQQREELNMNVNSTTYPAQVVDYPYVLAEDPGLTRMMLLLVGAFLGVVFAALYVYFFRMKVAPVISVSEIDTILDAPKLQALRSEQSDSSSLAINNDGANSETFRLLRSQVLFALNSCDGKVVAVTSMNNGEGKTFVAVNLAASLAAIGKRTLLVDASLRSPMVAEVLNIPNPSAALADYVLSSKKLSDVNIVSVPVGSRFSLDVITASAKSFNPSDIVASDRFADFIRLMKENYDYVIIDSSSVKGFSDIYHFTDVADITLMVCRVKVVSNADIEDINTLYADGRLKRLAVVKNDVK